MHTCVRVVLHGVEVFERLEALPCFELLLFRVVEELGQLLVEGPERVDLPQPPLHVDRLVGCVGPALPEVGRVVLPVQAGQLLADVDPLLTQVDALSKKKDSKC